MSDMENREHREEREEPGFLSSLFSKLGLGGGEKAALGSVVGATREGAFLSGLLASKAGIVALVLAGTTVAAGLGVVGGHLGLFGGSSGASGQGISDWFGNLRSASGNFVSRTGSTAGGDAAPAAGPAGSLDYFKSANQGQLPDQNPPQGDSGSAAAVASDGSGTSRSGPDNANAPGNVGSLVAAASRPKLNPMQSPFGSAAIAGGGASAGASSGRAAGAGLESVGASHGFSSAMKTSGARAGGMSAVGAQGSMSRAVGQAMAARGDNFAALGARTPNTGRAGLTYDGAAAGPGIGGGSGVDIGGQGAGQGGGGINDVQPQANSAPLKELPPAPPATPNNTTPWQWAVYAFMGAAAGALGLLMAAGHFSKIGKSMATNPATAAAGAAKLALAKTLSMIATALAGVAAMMGVIIATTYQQTMQGLMFTAVGGILAFQAAMSIVKDGKAAEDAKSQAAKKETEVGKEIEKELESTEGAGSKISKSSGLVSGAPSSDKS